MYIAQMMNRHPERFLEFLCNVDKILRERKMHQNDLAYATEVGESYISKILNAHRKPGFDLIWSIADALKVKPGELLDPIPSEEELLHFKQALAERKLGRKNRRKQKVNTGK